jgi:hypothetical protein
MVRPGDVSDELSQRLRWHAGLEEAPDASGPSISSCIEWDGRVDANLERSVADFIAALSQLNVELNGKRPSQAGARATHISREVVYAVAEVVRLLRDVAGQGDQSAVASDAAWSIETAWRAVLDGDIDDIDEHVAEESRARRT